MNIIIIMIIFLFFCFFAIAFNIKKNIINNKIFVFIVKEVIPIISINFFGQVFNGLLSVSICEKKFCFDNYLFYIEKILVLISIIFLILITSFVTSIYYIPIFFKGNNNLKKVSSIPDQIFFVNKALIIIIFYIENILKKKNDSINQWIILIIIVSITCINSYFSFLYKNLENENIQMINNIMSLELFWGFFSLLLGKIFKFINFSGTSYLFIIGTILIFIYNFFYKNKLHKEYWDNSIHLYTNQERLNYFLKFIYIIEKRNISREDRVILNTLIERIEISCMDSNCKLKQYLSQLKKGIDSSILLYDYVNIIFKDMISQNKNDITSIIYYIIFLLLKLNRIKQAQILLIKLEDRQLILFQDLFNIYRAKKAIEELSINPKDEENNINYNNMINLAQYKKYKKEFKFMLYRVSSLYSSFWTLLLNSHNYQNESIEKLNNFGKEIKNLTPKVDELFNIINDFLNDTKIIKLYISFIKNVLVDKKLYQKYIKCLKNVSSESRLLNNDEDLSNFDLNRLNETDEFIWLLVSAREKSLGKIINLSVNICPIIGYRKHEIIGKHINYLIPNIFQKQHDNLLRKIYSDAKFHFHENLSKKMEYKPEIYTKFVYCKTKSKLLIPFPFKACFIQTEEGEQVFLMNIVKNKCFPFLKNINGDHPLCCVLTDNHFFIQTFTPNAFEYLGLNTKDIDSNLNITECISQFGFELLTNNDSNEKSMEINDIFNYSSNTNLDNNQSFYNSNTVKSEKRLKRELTKNRYSLPQLISWKYDHQLKDTNNNKIIITKLSSEKFKIKKKKSMEKKLFLQIKETKINGVAVGYKFLFKKMGLQKEPTQNKKSLLQTDVWDSELSDLNADGNTINNIINSPTLKLRSNIKDPIKKIDNPLLFSKSDRQINNIMRKTHSLDKTFSKYNINAPINELKISANFVPYCSSNLTFDLESMSYQYDSKKKGNNNLISILWQEAKEKVSTIKSLNNTSKNLQSILEKKKSNSKEDLNSSSNLSCSSSESSSSYYSSSLDNLSISHKNSEYEYEPEPKPEPEPEQEQVAYSEPEPKHYHSFMIQFKHKSPTLLNIPKSKNMTTKSHFDKKKSIKDQPLYEKISNKMKEKNNINFNFYFKYYEVKINNIRFLKYDFYKETIVEELYPDKKDQMTKIIKDIKSSLDKLEHKDENYPSINFEHFVQNKKRNKKDSLIQKNESTKKLSINKINFKKAKQMTENRIEKENKIYDSLNKKDKQHSIKYFTMISIICLLILYAICGINLFFFIEKVTKDITNIRLICESTELKFYFNSAIYFIRELTLINMKNITEIDSGVYMGFPSHNKTDYIKKLNLKVLEIYSSIHSLNELIISTEFSISKNSSYYFKDKEYIIERMKNDFELDYFRTDLRNGLISLDAYLYNLAELSSNIEQSHEDVYPFIHNALNDIGQLLNIQIVLYMNELELNWKKNIKTILIIHSIILIVLILILIIISKAYFSVLKNKANYFYIFYGIKFEVIQTLINDCEYFLQQFKEKQSILHDNSEEINTENSDKESSFIEQKPQKFQSIISEKNDSYYNKISSHNGKKAPIDKLIKNQRKNIENKKIINYKFNINSFIICFLLFLFIFFSLLIIVIENYYSFIKLISEYSIYNYNLQRFHNNLIEIFNGYREFLFDQNTLINGTLSNDYINNKLNEIYFLKFDENIIFNKYRNKIQDIYESYNEFNSQTLCSRINYDYFFSEEECNLHMKGITTYEISVVYTTITEEIRINKNLINQLLSNNAVFGNLTLYGSKYWIQDRIINDLKNANYSPSFYRLYLFNNDSFHKDLNILFINSLYPYIEEERKINNDSINGIIKNKEMSYITYYVCFLVLITLLFLILWVPMIRNMNIIIYTTKKMLSIIPIHILASQKNIQTLLNIEIDNKFKTNENDI